MNKYFEKFLDILVKQGFSYIPPSSSGKNEYILQYPNHSVILSNTIIDNAYNYCMKFRLSFIKGENLWYHPDSENIRFRHFIEYLNNII